MVLSKDEIYRAMTKWNRSWENHDLDGVMSLFHDQVLFENWTGGKVEGKERLLRAWKSWFENHGGFMFTDEDLFIDQEEQKVLYRWRLAWPSMEKGYEGQPEVRRGVDVIHFEDGKIIKKLTYSKTTVDIDDERVRLCAEV